MVRKIGLVILACGKKIVFLSFEPQLSIPYHTDQYRTPDKKRYAKLYDMYCSKYQHIPARTTLYRKNFLFYFFVNSWVSKVFLVNVETRSVVEGFFFTWNLWGLFECLETWILVKCHVIYNPINSRKIHVKYLYYIYK